MATVVQGFEDITQALALFKITTEEFTLIQAYQEEATALLTGFINEFYAWIPDIPEFKTLFSRPGLVDQVKSKTNYLLGASI